MLKKKTNAKLIFCIKKLFLNQVISYKSHDYLLVVNNFFPIVFHIIYNNFSIKLDYLKKHY